ncbi:MAG: transposase, partial [Permianibacter sp.]
NTLLGNLKKWLNGTFHGIRAAKYGQRYLREFQYRFNRRFSLSDMFARLLHIAAIGTPHTERTIRFLSTETAT